MKTSLRISNPKIYLARLSAFSFAFLTLFLLSCSSSEDPEYEIPTDDEPSVSILAPSEEGTSNDTTGNDNWLVVLRKRTH